AADECCPASRGRRCRSRLCDYGASRAHAAASGGADNLRQGRLEHMDFKSCVRQLSLTLIVAGVLSAMAFSQVQLSERDFRVFDGKGNRATIDQIVKAIGENDAVFLGEQHDDSVGHAVELEIFSRAVAAYFQKRKIALS